VVYYTFTLLKQLEQARALSQENKTTTSHVFKSNTIALAILTPYKEQVNLIKSKLALLGLGLGDAEDNKKKDMHGKKKGDWLCPNDKCRAVNFSSKMKCFKCSELKPKVSSDDSDALIPVVSTVRVDMYICIYMYIDRQTDIFSLYPFQ
jgi:hypothetical protein